MRYFAALFALGLACFQQVALAQAPADNPPPVFQNTQGLMVAKPQNGMTVYQGSSFIISALLAGQQPVGKRTSLPSSLVEPLHYEDTCY
jgi:hypothetical protein